MKQMTSGVSTIPYRQKLAVGEAFKAQQRQQVAQASPQISMAGVPGDPDHRKFLTPAFQNMETIQTGNSAGTVGSLAVSTNKNQWRDYDPGRFTGPYSPAGEYGPFVAVFYVQDPETFEYKRHEELDATRRIVGLPSRVVVTNPTKAGVFNIKAIGETDIF